MPATSLRAPRSSRRDFLRHAAACGPCLMIGLTLAPRAGAAVLGARPDSAPAHLPGEADMPAAPDLANAWLLIDRNGLTQLIVNKYDSGTAIQTSFGALLADELGVDLDSVRIIAPPNPFDPVYMQKDWGEFSTGGSTSIMTEYRNLREAAAAARTLLVESAAMRWRVPTQSCDTAHGHVVQLGGSRRIGFGELVGQAARLPAPRQVRLRALEDLPNVGKLRHKLGAESKCTGERRYTIDLQVPAMLVAGIERAPVLNARVKSLDAAEALRVAGVHAVLRVPGRPDLLGGNQEGVAVIADSFWSVQQARRKLRVQWEGGDAGFDSSRLPTEQHDTLQRSLRGDTAVEVVPTIRRGNLAASLASSARQLHASYVMPYKAANPMEPQCVITQVRDDGVHFWGPLQVPSNALFAAAMICGESDPARVHLHDADLIGGGSFGSRESRYWLLEAVWLARQTGRAIKLINTREDEMRALYYHAASYHHVVGALDARGRLRGLQVRAVVPASPERWQAGYDKRHPPMDYSTTEALCSWDFAYTVPALDVAWVRHETALPTGWYRAVSFIPNVFAVETFIDEVAQAAGADPHAYRRALMQGRPRHVAVLDQAVRRERDAFPGATEDVLGIATNQAYGSYCAVVVRLRGSGGAWRIRHVTCVADCGLAVLPGSVQEQLYGGVMWGLGHALHDRVQVVDGRVRESNFDDYPVMRMSEMPEVDVHIVDGDTRHPGGVGELAAPSTVAALGNALSRALGRRLRQTPFDVPELLGA